MSFALWIKLSPVNIVELVSTVPKARFQDSQPPEKGAVPTALPI